MPEICWTFEPVHSVISSFLFSTLLAITEIGKQIPEWVRTRIREKLIKYIFRKKQSQKRIWIIWRWAMHRHFPTLAVILSNIRIHCVRSYEPSSHISHPTITHYISMFTFVSDRICASISRKNFFFRPSCASKNLVQPDMNSSSDTTRGVTYTTAMSAFHRININLATYPQLLWYTTFT